MPQVVVIAGPNGAGKTTTAGVLLPEALGIGEFINADSIAAALSPADPTAAAVAAGRQMLARIRANAARGTSFAFETTLASRSFAPMLRRMSALHGYRCQLLFLALDNPALAIARVARRVASGGHHVAEDTVRRRYSRGIANFFALYRPLAAHWQLYDNSAEYSPALIAHGTARRTLAVRDPQVWRRFKSHAGRSDQQGV